MPLRPDIRSVLVIGSGPIVIGQACEFDYSGTQACRVLRGEGIRSLALLSGLSRSVGGGCGSTIAGPTAIESEITCTIEGETLQHLEVEGVKLVVETLWCAC